MQGLENYGITFSFFLLVTDFGLDFVQIVSVHPGDLNPISISSCSLKCLHNPLGTFMLSRAHSALLTTNYPFITRFVGIKGQKKA